MTDTLNWCEDCKLSPLTDSTVCDQCGFATVPRKTRPLPIFKPELRQAIREGRKTQTRRLVKHVGFSVSDTPGYDFHFRKNSCWHDVSCQEFLDNCPYGEPGDVAYLREPLERTPDGGVRYRDDGARELSLDAVDGFERWTWKRNALPSIHMPKRLARTFVRLTEIRVERLHDISEADAIAEGIVIVHSNGSRRFQNYMDRAGSFLSAEDSFQSLWRTIHDPLSWSANPWVWVISWEPVE